MELRAPKKLGVRGKVPLENKEKNQERSIRRTKKVVTELALCNLFDLFATFTFDQLKKNRYDFEACSKSIENWFKNQKKRNGKFRHIIVAEQHKDGAYHFHALLGGYSGVLIDSGTKINGRTAYNLKGYTLGFTTAIKVDNPEKISTYLVKYIKKGMVLFPGKKRYWASHGLKKAEVIDNPEPWYVGKTPDWSHISVNGVTMVFNKGEQNNA